MGDTVVELIHSKYTTGNMLRNSPSSSQSTIHSKSLQHSLFSCK